MEYLAKYYKGPLGAVGREVAGQQRQQQRCDATAADLSATADQVTALAAAVSDPHAGMERVGSSSVARLLVEGGVPEGFEGMRGETALLMASVSGPGIRHIGDSWYTAILDAVAHWLCLGGVLRASGVSQQFAHFVRFLPHFFLPGLRDQDVERLGQLAQKARVGAGAELIGQLADAFEADEGVSESEADRGIMRRFLQGAAASPFKGIRDERLVTLPNYVLRSPSLLFQDEPGVTLGSWLESGNPLPDSAVFAYHYAHLAFFLSYGLSVGRGVDEALVGPWPEALAFAEGGSARVYTFGTDDSPPSNVVFFATQARPVRVEPGTPAKDVALKNEEGSNMIMLDPEMAAVGSAGEAFLSDVRDAAVLTYAGLWELMARHFSEYAAETEGADAVVQRLPAAVEDSVEPHRGELVRASLLERAKAAGRATRAAPGLAAEQARRVAGAKSGRRRMLFPAVKQTLKGVRAKFEEQDHLARLQRIAKAMDVRGLEAELWVRKLADAKYRKLLIELERAKANELFGASFPPVPVFAGQARVANPAWVGQWEVALYSPRTGYKRVALVLPPDSGLKDIADFAGKPVVKTILKRYVKLVPNPAPDRPRNAAFKDTKSGAVARFIIDVSSVPLVTNGQRPPRPAKPLPKVPKAPTAARPKISRDECVRFLKALSPMPLGAIVRQTWPGGVPQELVRAYGSGLATSPIRIFSGKQSIAKASVPGWQGQVAFLGPKAYNFLRIDPARNAVRILHNRESATIIGRREVFELELTLTEPDESPVGQTLSFVAEVENGCLLRDVGGSG